MIWDMAKSKVELEREIKAVVAKDIESGLRGAAQPGEYSHDRARRIVRLAANQVKNPSTKSWLLAD
jgi:hypothetical protein